MTTGAVHVFEHHDEAYHLWRAAGIRGAAVVHVDAHHDLAWLDDELHLDIGNYLCQALKDGIVGAVFWVVPDGTLSATRSRAEVRRHLRRLRSRYPRSRSKLRRTAQGFAIHLSGIPVVVCELVDLPSLDAPVLLDIDADYLLTPASAFHTGFPGHEPWIYPEQLLARLRAKIRAALMTTIAYSVEGGYTPLRWKFLGDELAARTTAPGSAAVRGFELIRAAYALMARGLHADAEAACNSALASLENGAAADFARATSMRQQRRFAEARDAWRSACERDPSYATGYRNDGPAALETGRVDLARQAFDDALALDAGDPFAHFGLARVAAERRDWHDVENRARAAIARGLDAPDVFRLLARALERQKRPHEAVAALKQALKVSLRGRPAACGALAARPRPGLPLHDGGHARTYATLGRLEGRLGDAGAAIAALRFAISAGYRDPVTHVRLARLYAGRRRWRAALDEIANALAVAPSMWAQPLERARDAVAMRLEALG